MLSLSRQNSNPMPSEGSGKDIKFAFVTGGVCESTPRYVAIPDSPGTKAFFVKIATMYKDDSCGDALCRATQTIHTISEVEAVLNKAREAAQTSSPFIRQELSENIHDTMLALGLALYEQLSTIYEEEAV